MSANEERPLVTNAADATQVKEARKKEKYTREHELKDWRAVLLLPEGRRVLWAILDQCKAFEEIYAATGDFYAAAEMIHYLAGKKSLGHFVLHEIQSADDDALFTMMRERQLEKKKRG